MSDPGAPTGWQIERSLAAWHELTERLDEDPSLIDEDNTIRSLLDNAGITHPDDLLRRLIDACAWTELRMAEADELRKDMTARRDKYKARSDRMRSTIADLMSTLGHRNIAARMMRAVIWQSPGRAVIVTDVDKIPDRFCKVERMPIKSAIRKAMVEDGEVIDGAELSNPGDVLTLRKV
jgi:hypothetical protein